MSTNVNTVTCSFCSTDDVNKIASFGTAQLVNQYYCNQCKTVFEYVRWRED